MFDPTIFDNLKVVIEGGLYDLDKEGQILIHGRQDNVDLANMSRSFRMQFHLPSMELDTAEVELSSGLTDFAAELARIRIVESIRPGCTLRIRFRFEKWQEQLSQLRSIQQALLEWWTNSVQIEQKIESTHVFTDERHQINNTYVVELTFAEKVDEEQIEELQGLLQHTVLSLKQLSDLIRS